MTAAIRFDPETQARIIAAYQDGRTARALSRDYGTASDRPIVRVLKAAGIYDPQRSRAGHDYSLTQRREMAVMYNAGSSIYAIAKVFEIKHPQNVWRILRGQGVEFRDGAWKGGRINATGGYAAVAIGPDDPYFSMANVTGYVLEHRLVMARSLGRPLERSETVHHINGDKRDNRIENLQLRQGKHGKGARFKCLDCGSHNVEATEL